MSPRILLWIVIGVVVLGSYAGSGLVELVVDYYWFAALGFPQVFGTILSARLGVGLAAGLVAFAFLFVNFAFAARQFGDPRQHLPPDFMASPLGAMIDQRTPGRLAALAALVFAVLTGVGAGTGWQTVMLWLNAVPFGHVDPIFGRDAGFYVFSLPFYRFVQATLRSMGLIALMGAAVVYYMRLQSERVAGAGAGDDLSALMNTPQARIVHLAALGAFFGLLVAWGLWLDRFEVMHGAGALFTGPGYADINGTLPVLAVKAVVALAASLGLLYAVTRRAWRLALGLVAVVAVVWLAGGAYGPVLQRFVVSPNELERERPYLDHHIKATNKAFALDRVVERRLDEETDLTMADIERNRPTVNNVRLWDHGPLLDTFGQIQEIRTYYDFASVDNDRYVLSGELTQTMLSPRELNNEALPSRTWVNERLTFTHGYGLTAGPVNRVNEQGLPVLYVQDLPPRSTVAELDVTRPEIYYGEVAKDYVFVKTLQQEFNYPEGDRNIFSTYEGTGGVGLGSLWRRLLLAAHTRDLKMLLSDDFTDETRVLLYRNIQERIRKVAPFFAFDRDPYMVIDDGKLFWIFDAYTVSERFPYSQRVGAIGNYMRNPVKAVIDAYNGTVTFYIVDPDEPIARAYGAVFPDMFRPIGEMSASLRAHLRHPADYFDVQAEMYATYHMLEVNTFYNKEDQWSVPEVGDQRMEPYYTVMRLPEEDEAEFILMLPFTPRLKDNLAAWMVARNDGDLLSQLVVYVFPKQRLIYGPKQMVGRINQDPIVSQQITLWDRAGSNVIRGTLLVIPIEQSLIYIQPLYLRSEDGRIPELKRVIVGYGNDIAMGVDLEDALNRIFGGTARSRPAALSGTATGAATAPSAPGSAQAPPAGSAAARAREHYDAMREAAAAGDWTRFGRELDALGKTLGELER